MEATFCRLVSLSTNHIGLVKLVTVCFHMLCSLLNILMLHLWVQFEKSFFLRPVTYSMTWIRIDRYVDLKKYCKVFCTLMSAASPHFSISGPSRTTPIQYIQILHFAYSFTYRNIETFSTDKFEPKGIITKPGDRVVPDPFGK